MSVQIQAYGVTLQIRVSGCDSCCGVRYIGNFSVRGRTGRLTRRQINNLYKLLYLRIRDEWQHVLIATDSVRFGWDGTGSSAERTENMCLGDMCEYLKFKKSPGGYNPNNRHEICVYTDSARKLNPAKDDWENKPLPKRPVIATPRPKASPVPSGEIDTIAQAIVRYITTGE